MKRLLPVMAIFSALAMLASSSLAADSFYEGKTVRVTVGFSPGGGFDTWARVVARHFGKHIPGKPLVVVENITGAGGVIQTTQLYSATKPDGLTIGFLNGGLLLSQALGQPGYAFDSRKFIYIGGPSKENPVYVFSKGSGIDSAEKWKNSPTPVKIGGLVPGNAIDNDARVVKDVLGFPTQIVTGYRGTADLLIAMESGELAGSPQTWDGLRNARKKALESGDIVIVLQGTAKPLGAIPNVPRVIEFAKTEEQKLFVMIAMHSANDLSRPFAVPVGTPSDRVELLRKAFQETMQDGEFLSEVEKMNLTLEPVTGEELTKAVESAAKLDEATKAKLREILFKN